MKKPFANLLIALLGGGAALFGCNKVSDTMAPQAAKASQNAEVGTKPTEAQLASQRNWLWYVEQLESGEATDPSGQYVRKTAVQLDGVKRPKYDGAKHVQDWGFSAFMAGRVPGKPVQQPCSDCLTRLMPVDEGGGGGGGGGVTVTSTFTSSVGQGGSGVIYDLKLVANTGYTTSANTTPQPGYTRLISDLNKGAGGAYIYLTFTRNQSDIKYYGPIGTNYAYGPLTKLSASVRSYLQGPPSWPTDHSPIWFLNANLGTLFNPVYIEELDLNLDCGIVDRVFAHQSKKPSFGSAISEVGVLSGNSDVIQPPTGWEKVGVDLNHGAGGDYIFLCLKR